MSSRGASGRQLLALAALEAAASPSSPRWCRRGWPGCCSRRSPPSAPSPRRVCTTTRAAHRRCGSPAPSRRSCSPAVLLGPLLRRRGSVVDAEQQLVRQDRRGGLARSGADLALLVLAGLAVWQLRAYRSPVVDVGSGTARPRAGRRTCPRCCSPAPSWRCGCCPWSRAPASGWRPAAGRSSPRSPRGRSVDAPAGPPARCSCSRSRWRSARSPSRSSARGGRPRATRWTSPSGPTSAWTAWTAPASPRRARSTPCADAQAASPVTFRSVTLGTPPTPRARAAAGRSTSSRWTPPRRTRLLRGRISPSWSTIAAPLHPTEPAAGIALPGSPSSLLVDVDERPVPRRDGLLLVSLVVEDPLGTRTPVELPPIPLRRARRTTSPPSCRPPPRACSWSGSSRRSSPTRRRPRQRVRRTGRRTLQLDVRVSDLRAVERPAGATEDTVTPVDAHVGDLDRAGRAAAGRQPAAAGGRTEDEALRVTGGIDPCRGHVRRRRVRRGDVPGARRPPGRRDRHARRRARRRRRRRARARPGRDAGADRRRPGGRLPARAADRRGRAGRPRPADARRPARLVDEPAARRVVAPGPRRERPRPGREGPPGGPRHRPSTA